MAREGTENEATENEATNWTARPVNNSSGDDCPLTTNEFMRLAWKHLKLSGQGFLVTVVPLDRDGVVESSQAIFLGTDDDLAELGALTCRLWERGHCLQCPDWLREIAGLPPEEAAGDAPEGNPMRGQ